MKIKLKKRKLKMVEKKTELELVEVGAILNSKIVEEERKWMMGGGKTV